MILSAHQPGYLPWLGYFDKIKRSNLFIYMDTVQLTNSSTINFITRNFIKTSQGPLLLTVPIKRKGFMNKSIIDLEIDYSQNWV
ncbi:WbqC family protein, partial [Pelagibacterales bacterium]|nr:WbqC family protein [Pelagibacterales bacterium]